MGIMGDYGGIFWRGMKEYDKFTNNPNSVWILVVFSSSSDVLMIEVRTKCEKSPKTLSLRLDLLW